MAIEAFSSVAAAPAGSEIDAGGLGDAGRAQGDDFAQLLAQAPGSGAGPARLDAAAVQSSTLQAGGRGGLGEEVLGGLRRFGETIGKMEAMGAYRHGAPRGASDPTANVTPATMLPGPAEKSPVAERRAEGRTKSGADSIDQAMAMAHDALGQQAQLYKVMMDFTLVHSSAESLNKSLKTLLTQGGG